jgi:hypothetical protein
MLFLNQGIIAYNQTIIEKSQMRIPAKLATESGDVGHHPERSDAGLL